MNSSRRPLVALALLLGGLVWGCDSTAERCGDYCVWNETCAGAERNGTCQRLCEDVYDVASNDCRDAFDTFADCLSDAKLVCVDAESKCEHELERFTEDCKGQL